MYFQNVPGYSNEMWIGYRAPLGNDNGCSFPPIAYWYRNATIPIYLFLVKKNWIR